MLGRLPKYLLQSSSLTKKRIHQPKICFLLSESVLSTSFICGGSDGVGRGQFLEQHPKPAAVSSLLGQDEGERAGEGLWNGTAFGCWRRLF